MTVKKRQKMSKDDRIINIFVYVMVTIVSLIMLYPFLNVVAVAFSDYSEYLKNPLMIFPKKINFDAFKFVFTNKMMFRSYGNTLFVAVSGTILGLLITTLTSYALSRKELLFKKGFMLFYVIVFVLHAGIIPNFIVMNKLGLYNSLWALILPTIMPIYHLILMKSFFESIPDSLVEAARIDGASELYTFSRIILPLSKPAIAAIGLFQAVIYWNDYFNGDVYIRDIEKWPLQLTLRQIITAANAAFVGAEGNIAEVDVSSIPTVSVQYASLIIVILPIVCIYPFVQKYFVSGIMLGAVKG